MFVPFPLPFWPRPISAQTAFGLDLGPRESFCCLFFLFFLVFSNLFFFLSSFCFFWPQLFHDVFEHFLQKKINGLSRLRGGTLLRLLFFFLFFFSRGLKI